MTDHRDSIFHIFPQDHSIEEANNDVKRPLKPLWVIGGNKSIFCVEKVEHIQQKVPEPI